MAKTVVGVFDDIDEARFALDELQTEGYPRDDVSLIASDVDRRFSSYFAEDTGAIDGSVRSGERAVAGVGAGVVIGAIAGLVVGLAALAVPGVGPIVAAGPIAALLIGGEIGGVAGGLIGGLTHVGVPEHDAHFYAEKVRHGATLLVLHTDDGLAEHAATIMRDNGATNVDGHTARHQALSTPMTPIGEGAPDFVPIDEDTPISIPATAAAGAAGAANFAALNGSPGALGAVVAAMTSATAGEETAGSEPDKPEEYTVVDKRSREVDAEEHDRDDVEAEQRMLNRQV